MPEGGCPPALALRGLVAGYRPGVPVLRGVDLSLPEGGVTAVVGPNGAGKSTLVKAVAGLVPVMEGRVERAGADMTGFAPDRLAERGVAYVPQTANVFRSLTVRENLALASRRAADRHGARAALEDRFPLLAEKSAARAGALSGGQRQVLAVAMALATSPALLMLDELSAGLSPVAADEMLHMVRGLADVGTTVLLVEQGVKRALGVSDRCVCLAEGRVEADGPAAEMARGTLLADIFMGRVRRAAGRAA